MYTVKRRRLRLSHCPEMEDGHLKSLMERIRGLRRFSLDREHSVLYVEYDLMECCLEAIERWLEGHGFVLDNGFVERFKRGWIHYVEDNERENLNRKPRSCCTLEEPEQRKDGV